MKILLFGGTSEGHELAGILSKAAIETLYCAATEYGANIIAAKEHIRINAGRLDSAQIVKLLNAESFQYVIDATHPYAVEATQCIRDAAQSCRVQYLRLLREQTGADGVYHVDTPREAVGVLNTDGRKILLTTGSKDLSSFTKVKDFAKRIYPRFLPVAETLTEALSLGYLPQNILMMQGPFSEEFNCAHLKQTGSAWLVTKQSGSAGGFKEKVSAAKRLGADVLVIGSPVREDGLSMLAICDLLNIPHEQKKDEATAQKRYFPLFTDLSGRRILVVGGGRIAQRRIHTLLPFASFIEVISPQLTPDLLKLAERNAISYTRKQFERADLKRCDLVLACTNERAVNHEIYQEASRKGIWHSICDRASECNFYFPAVVTNDMITVGVCGDGKKHQNVKAAADRIRKIFEE